MCEKKFLTLGAFSMALAVILGAFGAHGLKEILSPASLQIWDKANFYHFVHSLGLVSISAMHTSALKNGALNLSGWLMISGILVFSGSLYLLALSGVPWLGAITPIGGLAFIAAWLSLAYSAKNKD